MKRPGLAALLSLPLPGLGQAWLGSRRRGAIILLPLLVALLALAVVVALDPKRALDTILTRSALLAVLVVIAVVGIYHLLAVGDAFRLGRRLATAERSRLEAAAAAPGSMPPRRRRLSFGSPLLFIALAGVITFYGVIEFVGVRAYQAANAIFVDPSSGFVVPEASFSPRPVTAPPTGPATEPPAPTPTAVPVPQWAADGRLNLLLMGSDAGPGRWLARTDTMVVLSVDVATGRAALFGIPRNLVNVPLPPESAGAFPNGRFPQLLNGLYVYADQHPNDFPGDDARGFRAVTGAIQELVGQTLDGVVVVNLNGFVDLVNAIGGLWLDQPSSLYDAHYPVPDGSGYIEIYLPAGCHKLNGDRALEYARSRHQDDDYGRMLRQQRVLLALARQVDPVAMLPQVANLLQIAADNLFTTIQPDEIAELAVLAAQVDANAVETIRFAPPTYPEILTTKAINKIRDRFATAFDAPTASASPTPKPTSTPKPCPRS
jgi:polyisoprenyl-teichoic acid--peptidoglycan teichoic acid transferase